MCANARPVSTEVTGKAIVSDGYPNACHKYAVCTDTEGSYTCACKDGYDHDVNASSTSNEPGTFCTQINECLSPSMQNCDNETQVCLDLPPPEKWQCVECTPAPTTMPTCNDVGITVMISLFVTNDGLRLVGFY